MTLDLATRQRKQAAQRVLREIGRKERREAKAARPVSPKARVRDADYLAWLHDSIPCIACLIEGTSRIAYLEGPGQPVFYAMEAAHQKHVAGKGGLLGKRPDDADSCPLCAWHHRLAPNACDPAQRKFWARLGIDVGEFCAALFAAFKAGTSGSAVVREFAGRGRT